MTLTITEQPKVVSREEWLVARKQHLAREKQLTNLHDDVCAERRALPWVKVEKDYEFDTPDGKKSLADLFDGRSQLIIYHFMLGPGWREGCTGCSFLADHIDGANLHLAHHDVTLMAVSRAPLPEIQTFKSRMGWCFNWVSSFRSEFNYDYYVTFTKDDIANGKAFYNYTNTANVAEEMHGVSVFYRNEDGEVFHTYSAYARGGDILLGAHNFLDLTPKGRNEKEIMDWVRLHDRYDGSKQNGQASCSCGEA